MTAEVKGMVWEKMAQISPDLFCTFDQEGNFINVNNASKSVLGYDGEELIGRHYSEITHPEFLDLSYNAGQDILSGLDTNNFENCFIHKNKKVVFIQWSSIWSDEDQMFYSVGRDITHQKVKELRYKALINNSQDIIFSENTNGLITEVNPAFCTVFGVSQEEALNRPKSSFLPAEILTICETTSKDALTGNSPKFSLQLNCKSTGTIILEVVKIPVKLNNEIIGLQVIAKNVTPIVDSFRTIRKQANKLNTIFESITDGFFILGKRWNFTYINNEAEKILKLKRELKIGKFLQEVFPDEVGGEFHTHLRQAMELGQTVNFTSYLKGVNLWLQVKAFPSAEGLSVYFDDVTEQVRSKQENEKLSLVASNTTNGVIITDNQYEIEWVNEGFEKLTGYHLEEVVGKTPDNLLQAPNADLNIHKPDKPKLDAGKPVSFEMQYSKKNRDALWTSVQVNPFYDENGKLRGQVYILTDITERKKFQRELEKLSLVASKTNNGVLIADKEFKIEWINEGFTNLYGFSKHEAIGKKPVELLFCSKADKKTLDFVQENILDGKPISFEILNAKKSGEEVWASIEINVILDEKNVITGYIAVHTDITKLKNTEIDLSRLTKDLYRQNQDLQQFTYIVSHNLRSPVANALGLADILTKVDKNADLFVFTLSKLKQSVFRLDTVLRDVNTILSIRDNKGNIELEPVDIQNVVQQAQYALEEQLQAAGGKISLEMATGLHVRANKAYLYSIFYNLLSNAIKYRASNRELIINIKEYGNSETGIIISVADNGSGFDMLKARDNLFKLYKRFHQDKNGRGIGLYLIKTHLEAIGGHIEVTSQVNIGTKFLIYLPK